MRRFALVVAVAAIAVPGAGAASAPCGPKRAETLQIAGDARVYRMYWRNDRRTRSAHLRR